MQLKVGELCLGGGEFQIPRAKLQQTEITANIYLFNDDKILATGFKSNSWPNKMLNRTSTGKQPTRSQPQHVNANVRPTQSPLQPRRPLPLIHCDYERDVITSKWTRRSGTVAGDGTGDGRQGGVSRKSWCLIPEVWRLETSLFTNKQGVLSCPKSTWKVPGLSRNTSLGT